MHAFGLCTIHYKSRTHSYCLFMLSYAPHRAEPFWHHKIPDAVSVRQIYYIPVSSSIVPCNHNKASEMHFNAFQCIAQPNTVLHDCILYLPQYYDPGISPGSANQCILGGVYLRSNLSRKQQYNSLQSQQSTCITCLHSIGTVKTRLKTAF